MSRKGLLLVLVGLSGSGKSFLGDQLVTSLEFTHVPSITTRSPRENERAGIDRIFCSVNEFNRLKSENQLICISYMFGNWYGNDIRLLKQYTEGKNIVCQLRYNSVAEMKNALPETVSIYIWPASIQAARARLQERAISDTEKAERVSEFNEEVEFADKDKVSGSALFDYHFTNEYDVASAWRFIDLVRNISNMRA